MFILALFILVKPVIPVLDYIVNYEYIATELCENVAKPELNCNGKCHLTKELAKASESEKPISSDKKQTTHQEIELLFCKEIDELNVMFNFSFLDKIKQTFYQDLYKSVALYSIFHPPIFIS
ncbi:hypothetical protein LXD69_09120 [Flavobacterium sediminilitoris]|uniref:Uncharacterized protein n=1 Tax=Flavobacterium sediminilitoris TaxID=2024526 RepID=A0ABY4HH99_9FLAO|nr:MULTISPECIES: hypothetical protein [Flavobacterium]UOX32217.1 hypothetical protein LXD69_09120 [Flavobacterium sediminilitoris]